MATRHQEQIQGSSVRLLTGVSIFWLSLSFLFDGLTTLVLPRDLEQVAGAMKATTLGLLTFFGLVVAMLVQPLAGAWSDRTRDRWGRRGMIGLGVALSLPPLALYALGGSGGVAIGYLLVLAAASLSQAGQQALIPDLIPPRRRGVASGFKGLADLTGAMLSFIVLGQVLSSGGRQAAIAVVAAVLVAGFLATTLLVDEPKHRNAASATVPRVGNPFRLDLEAHRGFVWLLASRFLVLLGVYSVGRFFLFFIGDRLGLDPDRAAEQAGALLGALTLMTLLAGPVAGWAADRVGRLPLMELGAPLIAVGALLLIATRSAWHVLVFGGLMALGTAAFTAANWAMTADVVPPAHAARFFGVANFGTMGAAAVAGLFGPLVDVANHSRPGSGYILLFAIAAAASLAGLVATRKVRVEVERPENAAGEE